MAADEELGWLLRILSSRIRREIITSLSKDKKGTRYSQLVAERSLSETNSGVFNFHLSKLIDSNLIQKKDDLYKLTWKGQLAAKFLDKIEEDFEELIGGKRLKMDEIGSRPWEQVKSQIGWVRQHAPRDPIATLGMAVMYIDGMYAILSNPHNLEIQINNAMSNLGEVAQREEEPEILSLTMKLSAIEKGDLKEYESSLEGLEKTIRLVEASPKWEKLLPSRLPKEYTEKAPDDWRELAKTTKDLVKEGRILDAIYMVRWTTFSILGYYAEGIPERTGQWRDTFLDSLIEIGEVDPEVEKSYMKAFGLKTYAIEDSMKLAEILDRHLELSRRIMAKHGIEDLTQQDL